MQAAIALWAIGGVILMLITVLGIGSMWQKYMVGTATWVLSIVAMLVVMAFATKWLFGLI